MTFFSPNTAEALASFTKTTVGMSQADLAAVFNYHVVPDFLGYSSVLETGMELQTVQGDNLTITQVGSDTFVNGAKIINPDFLVANGVVHLIDSVLDRFNTSAPNPNATAAPSPTLKPASKHSPSVGAKAGIGVSAALALIFLAIFIFFLLRFLRQRRTPEGQRGIEERPSLLPCFGRRKASERPAVPTEGSSLMRFLRKRTMSNRLSNTNGQYVRQIDSRRKANQVLGQDFELDANQIPNKAFEVSAVELDAGSLHGRPR
jgi:Fasciclin domain